MHMTIISWMVCDAWSYFFLNNSIAEKSKLSVLKGKCVVLPSVGKNSIQKYSFGNEMSVETLSSLF